MKTKNNKTAKTTTLKQRKQHRGHLIHRKPKDTEPQQADGIYFLKLVMYLMLGSLWIKITDGHTVQIPIPIGLMLGLVFAAHDKVQLDRKIGFAILLVAMMFGFWAPFGIFVSI